MKYCRRKMTWEILAVSTEVKNSVLQTARRAQKRKGWVDDYLQNFPLILIRFVFICLTDIMTFCTCINKMVRS